MDLLLLPGESQRNQAWIYQVEEALAPLFGKTLVWPYEHWQRGEERIAFADELSKVIAAAATLGPYLIFAKSIGTMLALRGMHDGGLTPQACLFVGLPLRGYVRKSGAPVGQWLTNSSVPVTVAQNDADPSGSFNELKTYLDKLPPHDKLVRLAGDTHSYEDYAQIRALARELLAQL